jgi:hypothetical protein
MNMAAVQAMRSFRGIVRFKMSEPACASSKPQASVLTRCVSWER